jgi:DNA-binding transcriptional ArsR family regulator
VATLTGRQVAEQPIRRVRAARAALLDGNATALLEQVTAVLCEANRTQIVRALEASPLTVTELAGVLGRSKSSTSRHVRVLRESGIVVGRRRGRRVVLSLAPGPALRSALAALEVVLVATGTGATSGSAPE